MGEGNFTDAAASVLVEYFRDNAGLLEQILKELRFDQIGGGVESFHDRFRMNVLPIVNRLPQESKRLLRKNQRGFAIHFSTLRTGAPPLWALPSLADSHFGSPRGAGKGRPLCGSGRSLCGKG